MEQGDNMRSVNTLICLILLSASGLAAEVKFTKAPAVTRAGGKTTVAFTVSAPTDVEVAILDAKGKVVRHLAAGAIGVGAQHAVPLQKGLAQSIVWDGKDDLGKVAVGGPFSVRVRAGSGFKFGRLIGENAYLFGGINSITTDAEGNLFVMGYRGALNQNMDSLRVFTPEGKYLRTLIPFAADLNPERVKRVATWNEARKTYITANTRSQMPQFYPWGAGVRVVSASKKAGIVLKHGTRIWRMDIDGGSVRGPFPMWSKAAKLKNPKWNVPQLAVSPDGRYIYYSNVAGTKYKPKDHKDFDPRWPQGRVYRQDTQAGGADPARFFDLTLPDYTVKKYWQPDAWNKRTAAYGINVDQKGHLYICDLVNQQIVEVSPAGKQLSATPAPWPERIHVNPKTGDYYVICRLKRPFDGYVDKKLLKISGRGAEAKVAATLPLKKWRGLGAASALGMDKDTAILWLGGGGALLCVRDAGDKFELVETGFKPDPYAQGDWNRITGDYARDEVYTNNGANYFWRYDGETGKAEILKKNGRPFLGADLSVGYTGLLYVRTGRGYSGPLERFTRDLKPAPFATGTHTLSKYVYSRYGVGNCEKGVGVGPKGESYVSFMYGWNKYMVIGFDANGKVMKGKYLDGLIKPDVKKGAPAAMTTAMVGPIPAASGGVCVDLKGNIYVGARVQPKGFKAPAGYEKSRAYLTWTGSIVKFGPQGGTFIGIPDGASQMPQAPRLTMARKVVAEGAVAAYAGLGPMSGSGYGGSGSSCVCRVPRFDVDPYGRLTIPNAVTTSVRIVDNAGNQIAEFGAYGNFDSQYVNPTLQEGSENRTPSITKPAIPLAWPNGAVWTAGRVYVNDVYNRRIVRVDQTYALEATTEIK
jgi:hypothetical protein